MEYIINDNTDKSLIYYERNVYSVEEQKELFDRLDTMDNFKEGDVNGIAVSRLQKWHQKDGKYFSPEWKNRYARWISCEYDSKLLVTFGSDTDVNVKSLRLYIIEEWPKLKDHNLTLHIYGNICNKL